MNKHTLTAAIILAGMAVAAVAQQFQSGIQTLDEVNVAGPQERERKRGPVTVLENPNHIQVRLQQAVDVRLRFVKSHQEMLFRRRSNARRLPKSDDPRSSASAGQHLLLQPDRLVVVKRPPIREAGFVLDASIDERDGLPAHIPFGTNVALVNLDYVGVSDGQRASSISLSNAMHPQTRKCERTMEVGEFWTDGTRPYVLMGKSLKDCKSAVEGREGDLLFAADVPAALRQAVVELHDPIASRLSNRLGSEPGNTFVAWWAESPHAGYRFEPGWSHDALLLFHGATWQQGIDAVRRDELRMIFIRQQIEHRVMADPPGPFVRSAVDYLVSLTRSDEDGTTLETLQRELPAWIAGCASRLQVQAGTADFDQDVHSVECGLVLQFVYDAVARSGSAGKQNIYDTWRRLLERSWRDGRFGARPADFLASSAPALRIVKSLANGSADRSEFAAALARVGVKLRAVPGASGAEFEVQSLEYF